MNIYSIRIDFLEDITIRKENFIKWFDLYKRKFESYVIAQELAPESGKDHIHGYIKTKVKIDTLRMHFKTHNVQRQSEYSIAIAKYPMRLLCYVTKDCKILDRKNITDKYIDEVNKKVEKENSLSKTKNVDKMFLFVSERIGSKVDRYEIASLMMDFCSQESYTPNKWLLISYYNVIHWRLKDLDVGNFDKKLFLDDLMNFGSAF